LYWNKGFINTINAITRIPMRTARNLEPEWRCVLRVSLSTGGKEDETITGRVSAARFHHVTASSLLVHVFKHLWTVYFFNLRIIFRAAVNRGYWISGYGSTTVLQYRFLNLCHWQNFKMCLLFFQETLRYNKNTNQRIHEM
jgi:hypothetical protein